MFKSSLVFPAQQISRFSGFRPVLALLLLIVSALFNTASAQNALNGATPSGLTPGAPTGSYPLSGFESVNPYNGGLNFSLPLVSVGGRGAAGATASLKIEQKWMVETQGDVVKTSYPNHTGWLQLVSYIGARIDGRTGGDTTEPCIPPGSSDPDGVRYYNKTLTRLTVTLVDGTEIELRDMPTDGDQSTRMQRAGQPKLVTKDQNGCAPNNPPRGKLFVTADGTSATFISDDNISDNPDPSSDTTHTLSGNLFLRDGTRYRFDNNQVSWIRDRNGNKLTFSYPAGKTIVTDSLNRTVEVERDVTDPNDQFCVGTCDRLEYTGFGGAPRTIYVTKTKLENALRIGETPKTPKVLFPPLAGTDSTYFNPTIISSVRLPNGKQYQFKYNSYGELARVDLPSGGAIEYDWQAGDAASESDGGVIVVEETQSDYAIYRRVAERRVYENGSTLEQKMIYPRVAEINNNAESTAQVETRNSGGDLLAKTKHYYHGSARQSFSQSAINYSKWREGREYKTETFDFNGTTVLRTTEQAWEQRAAVSWWTGSADDAPPLDPRVVETVSTLNDASSVTKTKTSSINPVTCARGFDQFNNQTDVYEYDYAASFINCGLQGATNGLVRRTHNEYATNPTANENYISLATTTAASAHIRNLPTKTWVSTDAATHEDSAYIKSYTTFRYDYYVDDSQYFGALLVNRPNISGHDSISRAERGNVTSTARWFVVGGDLTGDWIGTYQQYDIAGNVVKVKDANGNVTVADYDDNYGSPSGNVTDKTLPAALSATEQTSYAFATTVTNALGQSAYSQFDFYTGMAVDGKDINGVVSSGDTDDDSLDRPKQIIRAIGTSEQNQTTFHYDDTNRIITTTSDQDIFNDDTPLKSEVKYDGLGRTTETRRYETATGFITQKQTYDALGRVKEAYNPYRTTSDATYGKTENTYDALGRITEVETPDGAKVKSAYDGARTLVTDQASKQRISRTDALGRLREVWEIKAQDAQNSDTQLEAVSFPGSAPQVAHGYKTLYDYDVLGNLTTVTQGTQQTPRSFVYDSLSRLKSAENPESGVITYEYDNNGNLKTKRDQRGIKTVYDYDVLNRVVKRCYRTIGTTAPLGSMTCAGNNETVEPNTPEVSYTYENANIANSQGRLTKVENGNSTTEYTAIDPLGRVKASRQTTKINNVDYPYNFSYTYDLVGNLKTETYPSGRVVIQSYNTDGSLNSVTGTLAGQTKTYASGFTYTAHGAVKEMQLGNGKFETTAFNSRLQPTQIGLGNIAADTALWKVNYNYGTTANNGNILSQTITAPNAASGQPAVVLMQNYSYDSLNRLEQAAEMGAANWKQTFKYDRFGNRRFNTDVAGNNTTIDGCLQNICNPLISSANNRFDVNQGYDYDSAGNLIKDAQDKRFAYDAENKQKRFGTNGTNTGAGEYWYDGDGKRVRKKEQITVSQEDVIFVYDAFGKLAAEYTLNPQANQTAATNYLTQDTLGSPRVITNQSGTVESRRDFLPFGEDLTVGRSSAQGFQPDNTRQRFTGYQKDQESNLDFAKARMYGGFHGRFTSPDPLQASAKAANPQTWNRYTYVLNNPLIFIDPDGMKPRWYTNFNRETGETTYRLSDGLPGKGWDRYTGSAIVRAEGRMWQLTSEGAKPIAMRASGGAATRSQAAQTSNSGGYVNQALINQTANNTAPIPAATALFMGSSAAIGVTGGAAAYALPSAFATAEGGAVFWSGGDLAKTTAMRFADFTGRRTIEMTAGGKVLNAADPYIRRLFPEETTKRLWERASEYFANGSSGPTNVFLRQQLRPDNAWEKIERPLLKQWGQKIEEYIVGP